MATSAEVLTMLCKGQAWTIYDNDYGTINWDGKAPPITQAQFEAGFAQYDAFKAEQDAKAATDKAALLAKLGITAEEAKLLLS